MEERMDDALNFKLKKFAVEAFSKNSLSDFNLQNDEEINLHTDRSHEVMRNLKNIEYIAVISKIRIRISTNSHSYNDDEYYMDLQTRTFFEINNKETDIGESEKILLVSQANIKAMDVINYMLLNSELSRARIDYN